MVKPALTHPEESLPGTPDPIPPLLRATDLCVDFIKTSSVSRAVHRLSLQVQRGETLCLVGESGCGKSVTSLAIMGLIQSPPGQISGGSITFNGVDLLGLTPRERRKLRGTRMGMIFQDPSTALNPVFTIGDQICEPLRVHLGMSRRQAREEAVELLNSMGMPSPRERLDDYPHQLSGGLKQRVVIACALACNPDLLIADEPTTALDVTVQAQILRLLRQLKIERDLAMIFITHDLGVVAQVADRVAVLYSGMVVEEAPVDHLFRNPQHPYTAGLLNSLPRLPAPGEERQAQLNTIPGTVQPLGAPPVRCVFAERCPKVQPRCLVEIPPMAEISREHRARCILAVKEGGQVNGGTTGLREGSHP